MRKGLKRNEMNDHKKVILLVIITTSSTFIVTILTLSTMRVWLFISSSSLYILRIDSVPPVFYRCNTKSK